MTVSIRVLGGDDDGSGSGGDHLCNNGGWLEVINFAAALDPETDPNLVILGEEGWCDDPPALKKEITRALSRAGGVAREVLEKILDVIDTYGDDAGGIVVTS